MVIYANVHEILDIRRNEALESFKAQKVESSTSLAAVRSVSFLKLYRHITSYNFSLISTLL